MASEKYFPRDLSLDAKNHEKFKELVESDLARALSPFYKKTMKDVFMYALGIGFFNHKRLKLQKKIGTIPLRTLSPSDIALIKAIAVVEKESLDVLHGENIKEVFEIAEEYANGGITTLHNMIFGDEPGDVDKRMEQHLREILETQALEPTSKPSVKSYSEILKDFENELRSFIQNKLEEEIGRDWWKQAIPPDVQQRCEERKENREKLPWMSDEEYPLIYYADFNDYFKIITRRDNWKKIFSRYFVDEAWIKTKLILELSPIRNDIAHNRELTAEKIQKLQISTQEILR
ncbi:MAG: Swt1 family HEPN domain-containing protein, partial [Thermoproteota archaeon]